MLFKFYRKTLDFHTLCQPIDMLKNIWFYLKVYKKTDSSPLLINYIDYLNIFLMLALCFELRKCFKSPHKSNNCTLFICKGNFHKNLLSPVWGWIPGSSSAALFPCAGPGLTMTHVRCVTGHVMARADLERRKGIERRWEKGRGGG